MTETVIPKRIGFRSVFILMMSVSLGLWLLTSPLLSLGLSKEWSIFFSTGISTALGLSFVLLVMESPAKSTSVRLKRLALAIVVSFAISFVLAFVAR